MNNLPGFLDLKGRAVPVVGGGDVTLPVEARAAGLTQGPVICAKQVE